jgi:hypothetical protein
MSIRRRVLLAGTAVAVATVSVLAVTAGPAAALPGFGTAPVSGSARPVTITAVTVGRHAGFDRVVLTASTGIPSWDVRYVPQVVRDGSGIPVPLRGAADIQVVVQGTDWLGHPSVQRDLAPGFAALRQVTGAGEFEAVLTYGIGQAGRSGFRAFTLTGPDRLVIDVRHP